jgi:hypothetical protein
VRITLALTPKEAAALTLLAKQRRGLSVGEFMTELAKVAIGKVGKG